MEHNLEHTISLLTRTPAALNVLLRDLPEVWTFRNEGDNTLTHLHQISRVMAHQYRRRWARGASTSGCCSAVATALPRKKGRPREAGMRTVQMDHSGAARIG
jgi:hypothetical protein